jgi:tight adherence protein B
MGNLTLVQLRWVTIAMLGMGGGVVLLRVALANAARLQAQLARQIQEIQELTAFLRLPLSASHLVAVQGLMLGAAFILMCVGSVLVASFLIVPPLSTKPVLQARRARRVAEMESQLDSWLTGLASTLRATPALGEAIEYSVALVACPLRDELDTLLKELRLGTPLESTLRRMGERIGSKTVMTALATLRIGQRTGGDLSRILESSASTLREMARLEGVVRVKTAEGKAQASVLAILPFPVVAMLNYLNPGFLQPLTEGARGHAVIACSLLLWAVSLWTTRRILHVDL